ncbi:MAG: hypothetical protein GXO47_10055 [Chlorobi bacterium]|nr:hypothetical protein [Chlorobiota bacterium]
MSIAKDISRILNDIKSDNTSGSGDLLSVLINKLLAYSNEIRDYSSDDIQNIKVAIKEFKNKMSDFAIISHFCNYLTNNLNDYKKKSFSFPDLINQYKTIWKYVNETAADNFINSININGKNILLHSHSSAVITLFKKLKNKNKNITIVQTEGRPAYEGRLQARKLASYGYKVNIVTDIGFSPIISEIDMALFGADKIYDDYIINKTGSHAIALICRENEIPVYVIADSRKFMKTVLSGNYSQPVRDPDEIWKEPPAKVIPVNYYFEPLPVKLITGIFTEKNI